MTNTFSDLSEVAQKGLTLYNDRLKPLLEPEQNGQALVLHVDTGEYIVAKTLSQARQAMHMRYPNADGRILSRLVGPDDSDALVRRAAGSRK